MYYNSDQIVNNNSTGTQPASAGSNVMTRQQLIDRILNSGEVTKVSQHLALVIFLLCEGSNQAKLSVRDLERITGWGRTAIRDHLSELEVFMKVTFGGGRAKTIFELQGVIEEAITAAVKTAVAPTPVVVVASQAATTNVVAVHPATKFVARQTATNDVVAGQTATIAARQTDANPADKEKVSPHTPLQKETYNTPSLSPVAPVVTAHKDPVQVSEFSIEGPGFRLDVKALEMAAGLVGMKRERALAIAEVVARDWAANNFKPSNPMAMVKAAIRSDNNQSAIQDVRMANAKAWGAPKKPKLSRW